ncbi:MAG: RIP metalloprotease RseP [Gammaproteobacteria bacterium]|nr:RIP metalloprotease RseP [Gammaproteobacteria bacterium]
MEAINVLIYPLALIVTLGLLVTIHELGHFVIARWSGVKVLRFSVGFGRPIWTRLDKHGTEFVIARIPFGGYVRMLDDRDPESVGEIRPGDKAYLSVSVWWRIAIALGGPLANLLLAIVVYWCLFVAGATVYVPVVGEVLEGSPAYTAGLQPGQEIIAVDGATTRSWQQIGMGLLGRLGDSGSIQITARGPGELSTTDYLLPIENWHQGVDTPDLFGSLGLQVLIPAIVGTLMEDGPAAGSGLRLGDRITAVDGQPVTDFSGWALAIQAAPERSIRLTVRRGDAERYIDVVPASREATDGSEVGYLGVRPPTQEVRYGPLAALPRSVEEMIDKTSLTLNLLKKMVFGQVSLKNLSSPIMIAKVAGDSARSGWQSFFNILALLSISLGVLNLLPIPILDGGHVAYCVMEIVTGKPVSERVQAVGTQVGLFLVGSIFLLAIYNDLTRFF